MVILFTTVKMTFFYRHILVAVIAINSVRCPLCQALAGTGDRNTGELTGGNYPEMQESEWSTPEPKYPPTHPCHRFSDPDYEKMEFYSPGFDNEKTYRNETDCELVLTAPPGKRIKLDFLYYFEIEPSPNCANDYIEVRDGPRGYSRPMEDSPWCGKQFPRPLESEDRHLWVHFKSDENIEYRGFKAVFSYVDRPAEGVPEMLPCTIKTNISEEGSLSKSDIPAENIKFVNLNKVAMDCLWKIAVRPEMKIQLQFKEFELDKPNECEWNFVEVYSTKTDEAHLKKKFCGSIADTVTSDSDKMFVRFFAAYENLNKSTFEANYTAFRELDKQQKLGCREDEFDCEDATCISSSLRCNGRYNCRFRWDEDNCQ